MSRGRLTYHQKQLRKKQKHLHLRQAKTDVPKPIHIHFHDNNEPEKPEHTGQQCQVHDSGDVAQGTVISGTAHIQPTAVEKVRQFLVELAPASQAIQSETAIRPTQEESLTKPSDSLHYSQVTKEIVRFFP